jgi:hypothetical protein
MKVYFEATRQDDLSDGGGEDLHSLLKIIFLILNTGF